MKIMFWRWEVLLLMVCLSLLSPDERIRAQPPPSPERSPQREGPFRMTTQRGGQKVSIETGVPLAGLIKRLEQGWKFVSTGKLYFIGYPDDMYSIAAHEEAAIEPLLKFIKETSSNHAQDGAILTLHLIGINSRGSGMREHFTNSKAREALLGLLSEERLRDIVMSLLVRDPWPSDVPTLMEVMNTSDSDCGSIVRGLVRYPFAESPFRQVISASVHRLNVYLLDPESPDQRISLCQMVEIEHRNFWDKIKRTLGMQHTVLSRQERFGEIRDWKLQHIEHSQFEEISLLRGVNLTALVGKLLNHDYFDLLLYCSVYYPSWDSPFLYFVEGDQFVLCGPRTAKQRWLRWYEEQLEKEGPKFLTEEEF